ncbi:putative aig2 family protein [Rosellinia necatrix]|uniref:gamma-glutamylcyclotransferase n=1 Tax=Rosellinia necatrix TaxID=77044 RepID=A0A1W2TGI3_ROSNE|nr:putative aig2 family protein [Rosellinia necatrix]
MPRQGGDATQLYFAYGSSLWLEQMAARCPSSIYVGHAILPDHRWHINERGYGNVVAASGFSIHGLVYELTTEDELYLDKVEGLALGFYTKSYLSVILYVAPPALNVPVQQLVEKGRSGRVLDAAQLLSTPMRYRQASLQRNVTVYLSKTFVLNGAPRDEYIRRVNFGIHDAVSLGAPADFFETWVQPWVRPWVPPSAILPCFDS